MELEAKHIIPYLDHKARMRPPDKYNFSGLSIFEACNLNVEGIEATGYVKFVGIGGYYPINHFKLILHPLDLTKPVEHNGEESFSPIVRLSEMLYEREPESIGSVHDAAEWITFMEVDSVDGLPHWIVEWLAEHHFNFQNLPEELWVNYNDEEL